MLGFIVTQWKWLMNRYSKCQCKIMLSQWWHVFHPHLRCPFAVWKFFTLSLLRWVVTPHQRFEIVETESGLPTSQEVDFCTVLGAFYQQRTLGTSVGGKETLTSNQPLPSEVPFSQLQKGEKSDINLWKEGGKD
jgi:hypothetical protein